jgi:hypothetical protein
MALSQDPVKRAAQLANLRGVGVESSHTTHGANSGRLIREATGEHLASMAGQFPHATEAELTLQASRWAQIERLTDYVHTRGLIRNQRSGTVINAADMLVKLSSAFERQHERLLAREQATPTRPGESLEAIIAELTAGDASDQDGTAGGERP